MTSYRDEERIYHKGFRDGWTAALEQTGVDEWELESRRREERKYNPKPKRKRKRKLSAWNKFVKANSKKKRFIYQSGSKRGKLNLRKMGVAFRKTPAGRKRK